MEHPHPCIRETFIRRASPISLPIGLEPIFDGLRGHVRVGEHTDRFRQWPSLTLNEFGERLSHEVGPGAPIFDERYRQWRGAFLAAGIATPYPQGDPSRDHCVAVESHRDRSRNASCTARENVDG